MPYITETENQNRILELNRLSEINGELLEALKFAMSQLECYHRLHNDPATTPCILKARQAIAKAIQ